MSLLAKRMAGRASRNRVDRAYMLIRQGFLRELRTRTPSVSLRELARFAKLPMARLGELEHGRGKRVTLAEAIAIADVLYSPGALETDGICRVCGCTDDWACDGGCEWVNAQHTLCSACEEPAL